MKRCMYFFELNNERKVRIREKHILRSYYYDFVKPWLSISKTQVRAISTITILYYSYTKMYWTLAERKKPITTLVPHLLAPVNWDYLDPIFLVKRKLMKMKMYVYSLTFFAFCVVFYFVIHLFSTMECCLFT